MSELILANHSLRSATSFEERVAAAASVGVHAIGIDLAAFRQLREHGTSVATMQAVLADHGVRLAEIEVLLGFAVSADQRDDEPFPGLVYSTPEDEAVFFEIADAFGVRHLQTVGTFGRPLEGDAVEAFAGLCERAAAHDLLVAIEFVPGTNIPDAGVAARIVVEADQPNGGVCLDGWHHFRGANDLDLIRELPPEKVFVVQLNDGPSEPVDPDFLTDTLHHRVPIGEGAFDLSALLGTLHDMGVTAPISVEVMSDDLDSLGARVAAERNVAAARKVLTGSRP